MKIYHHYTHLHTVSDAHDHVVHAGAPEELAPVQVREHCGTDVLALVESLDTSIHSDRQSMKWRQY